MLVAAMPLFLFFVVAGHGINDTTVFLSSPKPLFALGILAPLVAAFLGFEEAAQQQVVVADTTQDTGINTVGHQWDDEEEETMC